MSKEKLIRKFNKQAKIYEVRRRRQSEKEWREKLIGSAKGRVLEVSVGAGANFQFYPKDVEITAVDFSEEMIKKARIAAADNGVKVDFLVSDVESLSFLDNSFDTIVSTLSFCGYEEPSLVLQAFQRWCKPEGQILFMEHGISSNRLARQLQRMVDPLFKRMVGCHLNRDIIQILKDSNLHIRQMEHHRIGVFHLVWAAPNKQSNL